MTWVVPVGAALLVAQSVATMLVPRGAALALLELHAATPSVLLPAVLFLGVYPDLKLPQGAALSFALGYLVDLFSGSPMGLQTFVLTATFMLCRAAGLRFVLRNVGYQVLLTFVASIVTGCMTLALRAIFDRAPPFAAPTAAETMVTLGSNAVATALFAPLVFWIVQRVEAFANRGREDARARVR